MKKNIVKTDEIMRAVAEGLEINWETILRAVEQWEKEENKMTKPEH